MASTPDIMKVFDTGATRNKSDDKLDFEGFISPLVARRYAQFMHHNRHLPDGSMRASDNWQLGIPKEAYIKSLLRHVNDVHLHHDGFGILAVEDLETALCAVIFNAMGYLFEIEKAKTQSEVDLFGR